jgi:hypothetical protein
VSGSKGLITRAFKLQSDVEDSTALSTEEGSINSKNGLRADEDSMGVTPGNGVGHVPA